MALNFNSLPTDRGTSPDRQSVFEKGIYLAVSRKAEMRRGSSGTEYLVVSTQLTDPATGRTTMLYDNFYATDKTLNRFKIGQFLRAIGTIPSGDFELKDLCKVVVNKQYKVAVKVEKSEGYEDKNVADVFDDDIYYAVNNAAPTSSHPADEELPFEVEGGAEEY